MNYIKPYLILSNDDCGKDSTGACYSDATIKFLNGDVQNINLYSDNRYYKAVLNDGSVFMLRTASEDEYNSGTCALIWYDINGTKEPNTYGKDIFLFSVIPAGFIPRETNCIRSGAGMGCAKYILKNGNMDYLH